MTAILITPFQCPIVLARCDIDCNQYISNVSDSVLKLQFVNAAANIDRHRLCCIIIVIRQGNPPVGTFKVELNCKTPKISSVMYKTHPQYESYTREITEISMTSWLACWLPFPIL